MSFKTNISFSILGFALILFNVSTSYIADYGNSFQTDDIELVETIVKNDISNFLFLDDNVEEEIDDDFDCYFGCSKFYSSVNFCDKSISSQNLTSLSYSIISDKLIRYSIQPSSFDDYENS